MRHTIWDPNSIHAWMKNMWTQLMWKCYPRAAVLSLPVTLKQLCMTARRCSDWNFLTASSLNLNSGDWAWHDFDRGKLNRGLPGSVRRHRHHSAALAGKSCLWTFSDCLRPPTRLIMPQSFTSQAAVIVTVNIMLAVTVTAILAMDARY